MAGKISLVINALLIVAVIFLFTSKSDDPDLELPTQTLQSDHVSGDSGSLKLAYIMEDSILTGYEFVKIEGKYMNEKVNQKQFQIQKEMVSYQNEASKWESVLASNQDEATYNLAMEDMQRRELKLKNMNDAVENMQLQFSSDLTERVQDYLKIFAEENDLDMILNDSQIGSSLLYSRDSFNVTAAVLEGLNKEYAAEIAAAEEEE